jgi:hypothetical protein
VTRLLIAVALAACAKRDAAPTELGKQAAACKQASDAVRAAGADDPALVEAQVNRLAACGDACDGKDAASCAELDDQLTRMCAISTAACKGLCDPAKPSSLSAAACKRAK